MLENLITTFIISFSIQLFFYTVAATIKTDKFTDLAYGSTFALISAYFIFTKIQNPFVLSIAFLIIFWAVRLSYYLFTRIIYIGRDKRFDGIREKPLSFLQFWILQAVSIVIIVSPLTTIANTQNSHPNLIIYLIGLFLWTIGFTVESIADHQKTIFKKSHPEKWIDTGLWKYSRHPNYFGEILVWIGVFIASSSLFTQQSQYLSITSPAFITILLIFVSGIPPLEKHQLQKYGNDPKYQKYLSQTSLLIPLPNNR